MEDKGKIRYSLKKVQRVRTWQLLILLIIASFVAATFLRLNNIGMKERRDAVVAADKSGDQVAIKARLFDLQRFSSTHMNASGELSLEYQYNRDWQKKLDEAKNTPSNVNFHAAAEAVCRPRYSNWAGGAYMQCIMNELNSHQGSNSIAEASVSPPSPGPYQHSFFSPLWTPDFAGWSVLFAGFILLMIILRTITVLTLRMMLKRHYRDA